MSIEDNLKFGVDNEAESVFHVTLQEIVTVQDTLFPEHGSMSVLVIVADYVQHAVHCAAQVCCAELGFKLIFFHYYPGSNTFIQPGVWLWDSGCMLGKELQTLFNLFLDRLTNSDLGLSSARFACSKQCC